MGASRNRKRFNIKIKNQAVWPNPIDGSSSALVSSGSATSIAVSLTTAKSPDVIVACLTTQNDAGKAFTIADTAGLSWNFRGKKSLGTGNNQEVDWWYAISNGPLSSDVITVTANGAGGLYAAMLTVFGVNGAYTAAPFDTNPSIPVSSAGVSTSAGYTVTGIRTNAAVALLFGSAAIGYGGASSPPGWTNIANSGNEAGGYNSVDCALVTSPQTGITAAWTGYPYGYPYAAFVDAIIPSTSITPPVTANLTVITTPVAGEVYVDGTDEGAAPVTVTLPVGSHTISFGNVTGYITPLDQMIDLTAVTTVTGVYTVAPPVAYTLTVNTAPVAGEVFVDGVDEGKAPVSVNLPAGTITVTFGAVAGYTAPPARTIDFTAAMTVTGTYRKPISKYRTPLIVTGIIAGAGVMGAVVARRVRGK